MRFSNPLGLLLLISILPIAVLGWPQRGAEQKKAALALGIRVIIVICLVTSLAGFEIVRRSDRLAVVFLVDVSDSMADSAIAQAYDYVRDSIEGMPANDQAAVILFGSEALVERPMSNSREFNEPRSVPATSQTNLADAIRLAIALYPPEAARRMVIISDGAITSGEAERAADLAEARNVEVVAVPIASESGPEALVEQVRVPEILRQGEQFDLEVSIAATQEMLAGIRVTVEGAIVYQGNLQIEPGTRAYTIPLAAENSGFIRYNVQITPEDDFYYQNNELRTYSQVIGPPQVLVIAPPAGEELHRGDEPRGDEAAQIVEALMSQDVQVDRLIPTRLPTELVELASFDGIVLVDTPARDLSNRQMESLQAYVRDLGGGLVVVGGPTSFGVGGYFQTPLEETLPLEMQIKDQLRRPTLTMVFIIDHSGSMTDTSGGITKLELAKEATIRSLELLFPTDQIGVIAFDEAAAWVVPITDLSDPNSVANAVGSIRSGGGTDIYAGVEAMSLVLPEVPSVIKHAILLTDGGADPTGIPALVEEMHTRHGITLTAVGIGTDAAPYLAELAEIGGGRYHFAADPGSIPSIFTEETSLAMRSYIVEETFFPELTARSPILSGITEIPPLHGYIGTTAKQTAQTILSSPRGDPILAAWQYGLGRAVAFTSDATGRWAREWIRWKGFPTFWSQAVNYTLRDRTDKNIELQVSQEGETAQMLVDAQSQPGVYLNDYSVRANLVSPDRSTQEIPLNQVAPGQYAADFQPDTPGVYLITLQGKPNSGIERERFSITTGWSMTYSPEYRRLESNPEYLNELVDRVGGSILEEPQQAFEHTLSSQATSQPAWHWLLALAAFLLPVDVAVRRLVISWSDVRRWAAGVSARLRFSPASGPIPSARSEQMDALFRAKRRTRTEEDALNSSSTEAPSANPITQREPEKYPQPFPPGSSIGRVEKQEVEEGTQEFGEGTQAERAERSTAAHLLSLKKRRQEESD